MRHPPLENKEMQIPLGQLTDRNDTASRFFHTFAAFSVS
jgi:hypothetical protein